MDNRRVEPMGKIIEETQDRATKRFRANEKPEWVDNGEEDLEDKEGTGTGSKPCGNKSSKANTVPGSVPGSRLKRSFQSMSEGSTAKESLEDEISAVQSQRVLRKPLRRNTSNGI
jgi:hypothetical protein